MALPDITLAVRMGAAAAVVYMVASIVQVMTTEAVKLPLDKLTALAKKRIGCKDSEKYPLRGKVAIVTGSTNGLGEQMAIQLHNLGATVVIASRTFDKCVSTGAKILALHPDSCGKIFTRVLDTSDLDSVKSFADWFSATSERLDYLVNNAGRFLVAICRLNSIDTKTKLNLY